MYMVNARGQYTLSVYYLSACAGRLVQGRRLEGLMVRSKKTYALCTRATRAGSVYAMFVCVWDGW